VHFVNHFFNTSSINTCTHVLMYALNFFKVNKTVGKAKSQLFRRKSELPHDIATLTALDKHKRTGDFLTTTLDNNIG
jgi:hypothetical protein